MKVGKIIMACALTAMGVNATHAKSDKPNVVFIMLDDFGFSQLEAFSRGLSIKDCDPKLLKHTAEHAEYTPEQAFELVKIASPTLSRMADQGVRFNNAYACSNLCAPSRIGVATGILQNRWGIYRNIDTEAHGLKPNSHLAERMQERGYGTAHIGKWHVGSHDKKMFAAALKKHNINPDVIKSLWDLGKKNKGVFKGLKRKGYEGSTIAKDHALNNGFDYYFGYNQWESPFYNAVNIWENHKHAGVIKEYNTDVFTKKAMKFMDKTLDEGKPFYVQLHYHAVHSPIDPKAPEKYSTPFKTGIYDLDNFYAHVFGVDENVRMIEEYLKKRGEADNTIFIFTSDNGGSLGHKNPLPGNAPYVGHKGMMNLGGFRVPLFFYWPGRVTKSLEYDHVVTTLDILPTVVDAAGGTLPDGLDGKSLLPNILSENSAPVRDHLAIAGIHARVWGFNGRTSFFSHNASREKAPSGYVVITDSHIMRFVSKIVPNLYKEIPDGKDAAYELYDYRKDPGERNNIVDQSPEKFQQMKAIWKKDSAAYPKPIKWGEDKWEALMQP